MEQIAATDIRSANHGEVSAAEKEFQKLLIAAPENGNSFTTLLELPENQAMNLLTDHTDATERHRIGHSSNRALIERAADYSIIADEEAGLDVKPEPLDCGNPNSFDPTAGSGSEREKPLKRKERENKCKGGSKKSKTTTLEEGEKLPYVHVRARRGQATDSHSLAERVRREKINARMKLLQELVPGCNKISGTALVLDEIINHVQYLQRQVEHLSMRLATVNPRIDFNLNSLISGNQSMMSCNYLNMSMPLPVMCPEMPLNGNRQQFQQQWHAESLTQPVWVKEENHRNLGALDNSLMTYGSSAHSASLHSS